MVKSGSNPQRSINSLPNPYRKTTITTTTTIAASAAAASTATTTTTVSTEADDEGQRITNDGARRSPAGLNTHTAMAGRVSRGYRSTRASGHHGG